MPVLAQPYQVTEAFVSVTQRTAARKHPRIVDAITNAALQTRHNRTHFCLPAQARRGVIVPASYNSWLVTLSVLVAMLVSYTALQLAGRVAATERSGGRLWLFGGATAMGIGIWSMHFIGMLAYSVPIPLRYNVLTTLASLLIAMLTSGFALAIASRRDLTLERLAVGAVVMGAGICAMHYTGMAAIQIMPVITYDPPLVAASVVIAVTASFAALWLAFRLRSGQSWLMRLARGGAAVIMGLAISGMHYTAMAASMLAPGSFCWGGAAFDNSWLALTIGLIALGVLAITLISSVYDAHLESRTRRDALHLAQLNTDLQHGKSLLTLATRAAGIACWEFDVATRTTLWTENEIESLKAAGIDTLRSPDSLMALIHPDDAAMALDVIRDTLAEGREVCRFRARVVTQNHDIIHLQAQARVFRDEHGSLARLLGVCWDVSDHVLEEARRRELQERLRDASRQAGMAEVATGVLHSIGNVLNSLGVSASLVQAGLRDSRAGNVQRIGTLLAEQGEHLGRFIDSDERGREIPGYLLQLGEHLSAETTRLHTEARAISAHVEHICKIVAAQQTYARRGGVTEAINVAELVDSAIALTFGGGFDLQIERQFHAAPLLTLDRHKLIQILGNLLSNARHALKDKPQTQRVLTVRIHATDGPWVSIDVEDSGVGIHSEAIKRLFEFGFTTKPDGHGFGLHTSAILAKELGGEVRAHSDGPGRGARFTLRLPTTAIEQTAERRRA
jgi:NO-binding membrane sensor protein with MHYT domain/two-component sensor histidine kinase